jgi:nucleotide-binding universal stress UspA family protein
LDQPPVSGRQWIIGTIPVGPVAAENLPEVVVLGKGAMIELRTLLLATDLGPDSTPAFGHARLLAEKWGARLVLYHAVPVPEHRYAHWAFAHGHEVWMAAERHARAELERQAAVLTCPHEIVVERRPAPLDAILEAGHAYEPDLTIMGTHARVGLAHLMLGSVAEDVVLRAFGPILCVPPGAVAHGGYKRILVPTDFSDLSRRAFPLAACLAKRFDAEVIGLHVVQGSRGSTLGSLPEDLGRSTEEYLRAFFTEHFGAGNVTPSVRTGHVWERIAHGASSLAEGLVVMATRGHDSFSDRVLGSNTERVIRHAPCPVLVA